MKIHLQKFTIIYFVIWCFLFALGNIKWVENNSYIQFFTIRIGLTSLFVLLMLWWSGTGEIAKTSNSILITMAAYGLKMFFSAVIFIYYFHFNKENKEMAVLSGFVIFITFSILEVAYGLSLTKKK